MSFFKLEIKSNSEDQEFIIANLFEQQAVGIEEQESTVIAYFSTKEITEIEMQNFINQLTKNYTITTQLTKLENTNWNKKWERNYSPIEVADYCYIYAPFHPERNEFTHTILLEPKMAFGTGHHETTYLMISMMRDLSFSNKTVLDVGAGTGILSILAEKEGAEQILAIDIDPNAVENTKENANCNNCKKVTSLQGTAEDVNQEFDFVLANINRNVLLADAQSISNLLVNNGTLLLSGFYTEDLVMIEEKYEEIGFKKSASANKNNWQCVQFIKVGKKFEP